MPDYLPWHRAETRENTQQFRGISKKDTMVVAGRKEAVNNLFITGKIPCNYS
jgi:hypothetical protein